MRLDKLTIGSAKDSPTHRFKNLKNVIIDFDQNHWVTVVIGWNGTGKSNVLEALAVIFRDFVMGQRKPAFAFQLEYTIGSGDKQTFVSVDADPDREKEALIIHASLAAPIQGDLVKEFAPPKGKKLKLTEFFGRDSNYLPRYVFAYYSGESRRMQDVFRPYLESYDGQLRRGEDPGLKRLFYALPIHSQFVLLAFLIQQSPEIDAFLSDQLGMDPERGVDSILFVLRQPPWNSTAKDGDERFWNARGVVSEFLGRLQEVALAPIEANCTVPTSLWNKKKLQFKYLFLKNLTALRQLVGQQSASQFFRDLESTYVSQLIDEVRIRIKLMKNEECVVFRELSEGEQQLLTVLGLLRFTAGEESLFLLDEPDTHLNPRWAVDYLSYLRKFVANATHGQNTSQIILTTHNPMSIAELDREQVQVLRIEKEDGARRVVACYPEMPPRGMGYAAIITSDMFGIASTLDQPTQELLEQQRAFAAKEHLAESDQEALDAINAKLDRLGFRFFHPDDEFSRYLRLRNELLIRKFGDKDPVELAQYTVAMSREEREALAKRLIGELVAEMPRGDGEQGP